MEAQIASLSRYRFRLRSLATRPRGAVRRSRMLDCALRRHRGQPLFPVQTSAPVRRCGGHSPLVILIIWAVSVMWSNRATLPAELNC